MQETIQKDELIYGGVNFTPSAVSGMKKDDFVAQYAQSLVWPQFTWQERKSELEKAYDLCVHISDKIKEESKPPAKEKQKKADKEE